MTLGTIIAGTIAHWMGYIVIIGGTAWAISQIKD